MGYTEKCNNVDITGITQTIVSETAKSSDGQKLYLPWGDCSNLRFGKQGNCFCRIFDDPDYDYYLVRADSKTYVLENDETDAWGTTWNAGTSFISGKYYQKSPKLPLKNTLLNQHTALAPALSVIYILEVSSKPHTKLTISEDDHLQILEVLDDRDIWIETGVYYPDKLTWSY